MVNPIQVHLFEATDERLEVTRGHAWIRLGVEIEPLLEDTSSKGSVHRGCFNPWKTTGINP